MSTASLDQNAAGVTRWFRREPRKSHYPQVVPLGRRVRRRAKVLRRMIGDPHAGRTGSAQLVVCAALVVPTWIALGLTAALVPASRTGIGASHGGITILSTLAGEFALGAALLSVMRSWADRAVEAAIAGAGLLVYGIYRLLPVGTDSTTADTKGAQVFGSVCLVLAFGLLLLSVVHRPGSNQARHPLTVWVGLLLAALVALAIVHPAGTSVLSTDSSARLSGDLIIAATWAVLGVAAIYVGRTEGVQLKIWIGFTAICLAQARLALSVIHNPGLAVLSSSVLSTIAIAVTLFGAVWALQETIARNHGLIRQSLLALQGSEAQRREQAQAHEEAVHNLRSALTSIGTATHLLVTDRKVPLEGTERSSLIAALQSELDRARRLLTREWDGQLREFRLFEVLAPAVVNEQSQGADVEVYVPLGTTVLGDPERTHEVFAVLFDNARRHAPGSRVTVRSYASDGWLTVAVEDRGPGIPPSRLEQVFERGWTTSATGTGKGLGLYLARRLMEEQDGELIADNREGGGARFLVRLPLASAREEAPAGDRADPDQPSPTALAN
jgi:signal transduction histidine kinase